MCSAAASNSCHLALNLNIHHNRHALLHAVVSSAGRTEHATQVQALSRSLQLLQQANQGAAQIVGLQQQLLATKQAQLAAEKARADGLEQQLAALHEQLAAAAAAAAAQQG
jgi:hypothetical protein